MKPARHRKPCALTWALAAAAVGLLFLPSPAQAQETTGRLVGRVTDLGTGQPLSGVTVILQGEQGEDASLTDDRGEYSFVNLRVGTYVVRFYNANSSTKVERPDVAVTAGATVRADAGIPSQAGAVAETYVIKKRAAAVDVGTSRLGLTLDESYMQYVPVERTFGDLALKAPGAFLESSGSVSIAGASGLENTYIVDGLNVTGMEYGDIMNHRPDASGGSNLSLDFVKQLQINTGGYSAEFGGAMGGVVNVVTKSGSNEFHGSAFLYWSPYWLSGDPKRIFAKGSALSGVDKPDYDTNLGFELGGPIIKNKLFFWVGFAPRLEKSHFFRDVKAFVDENGDGVPDLDPASDPKDPQPVTNFLLRTRTRELRQSYQYGAKIDYLVAPEHTLTVSLFGSPTDSLHAFNRITGGGAEAVNDSNWVQQSLQKNNTDLSMKWVSQLLDRRLRIEGGFGLHRETYSEKSPFADLNSLNQLEWHADPAMPRPGVSLYDLEHIPGCEKVGDFDPCPVDDYHNGGYGQVKSYTGHRWMGDLKATILVPRNEIKVGAHLEYSTFDQTRYYSGPPGNRALIQNFFNGGPTTAVWNFFTIPRGSYASQLAESPTDAADPTKAYYQEQLIAQVKSVNTAYFIQDSIRPVRNLTLDLGVRLENQRLYDFRDNQFLSLLNLGPRLGVIYDPSDDGRSKIFAHYGRYYESVPLNLAARYFGGEGILQRFYDNSSPQCATPPTEWTGAGGEASGCKFLGANLLNNGAPYPVQPNIQGQHHHEIVAGFKHALTQDLVVGIDYTRRWLGAIIEDGTGDPNNFTFVLGNPGHVSADDLRETKRQADAKMAELAAAPEAQKAVLQAQLTDLKGKLANLTLLGKEPKPERTYNALTFSATKRLSQRWMVSAFYTYSRLIGNYNGLYDSDNTYFAPNGSNAYDTPELVLNRRGPLANDRPHSGRVDGFYQLPVGNKGTVIVGVSLAAYSGTPRNYVSQWYGQNQDIFLLPRGSAGRTPTITQTDFKAAYRRELSKTTSVEIFVDLFNLWNERTPVNLDDNYTFQLAAPIVNGTTNDLQYAKDINGSPISKNVNFGKPISFQAPFHGRIGARFLF